MQRAYVAGEFSPKGYDEADAECGRGEERSRDRTSDFVTSLTATF